jgi:hypothetical protein
LKYFSRKLMPWR